MGENDMACKIIVCLGGEKNILRFERCMSRLRFTIADAENINFNELKMIRNVTGVVRCRNNLYIVLKRELPIVYDAIKERLEKCNTLIELGKINKYIMCYKGILLVFTAFYLGEMFINIGHAQKSSILLFTMIFPFFVGVIADIFLGFIKWEYVNDVRKGIELYAPVRGKVIKKGMGSAFIQPDTNAIFSPTEGWVEEISNTNHAILIRSKDGVGVFIHIGVDTVNAEKDIFNSYVKIGDKVAKGEVILEFDDKRLIKMGYDITTYVEVLDYENIWDVLPYGDYAMENRPLFLLTKMGKCSIIHK